MLKLLVNFTADVQDIKGKERVNAKETNKSNKKVNSIRVEVDGTKKENIKLNQEMG